MMNSVVVIGSGAAGAQAAARLVEEGIEVLMLDVGNDNPSGRSEIPHQNFIDLRREDEEQHDYLLGRNFEGIPLGDVRVGAQLTPPRQFLYARSRELLPVVSDNFHPMQSLALGGLASGWGASVPPLTKEEMQGWPLTPAELKDHYQRVGERIGICGRRDDDLGPFLDDGLYLQPLPACDENAAMIDRVYHLRRSYFKARGVTIGAPRLAMMTSPEQDRGPFPGTDMEFWADHHECVYRPRQTIEVLRRFPEFSYQNDAFVTRMQERTEGVEIEFLNLKTQERQRVLAAHVILATGALSTARLVLRSFGEPGTQLPILCNPYTYFPSLAWLRLGQPTSPLRHSLTQLMMIHAPSGSRSRCSQVQFYSYRSLLLFKLLKEVPLPMAMSRKLLQLFSDYFVIAGLHQEDRPSKDKFVRLVGPHLDAPMEIHYRRTLSERQRKLRVEGQIEWLLYQLGLIPLKKIDPGKAASIHYAGCLPMRQHGAPFTTDSTGRLYGHHRIRVVDGSVLPHLPAKGLTFTVMANADRIALLLAEEFR